MPSPESDVFVVAYDVASSKRRARLARRLGQCGIRINLSVFEVRLAPDGLEALLADVRRILNATRDHVRVYPVCGRCQAGARILGRPLGLSTDPGVEEV